jgi:hypothetical protein
MPLLQRITTPITALLPDLNNVPQRRQAVGAIVASLVVHLILLLLFVALAGFVPEFRVEFKKKPPELQPLELQIVSLPEKKESQPEIVTPEELRERAQRMMIDSAGLAKADEAPKDAIFESDQEMKAASEKPGTGDLPLPSQDGKDRPFTAFANQDVILGSPNIPPASPAEASPVRPAPPQPPQPKPLFQPQPVPDSTDPKADASPAKPAESTPKATPPPLPDVIKPNDGQIAIAEKEKPAPAARLLRPQMEPRPIPDSSKSKEERTDMAKLITPPPRPMPAPQQPGFQEQLEKTKVDGGISNRGKASVDAVKTPLAVYKKQVKAAIGSRWYFYVQQRRDLISPGSAKVSYRITKKGKITDIKVVENTSNQVFSLICEQSIREAEIGPPPDEANASMIDGRLEEDLTFTYYAGY